MWAEERTKVFAASLAVVAAVGCGSSEHAGMPTSAMGGSAAVAGSGARAGGDSGADAGGGKQGGSDVGGSEAAGESGSRGGSSAAGGNDGGSDGGDSTLGGSPNGTEPSAVDRGWALWTMPNPAQSGLPNPAKYDTTSDPTLVHDLVTGLTWPRALSADYHDQLDAIATCKALSLGGFDDWRLPTLIEYHSLLDWTHTNPAIDTVAFPDPGDRADNLFWTASPNVSDPLDGAWIADFSFITAIATHPINDRFPLRCVRGGGNPPAVHYMLEADTVLDVSTGLTWERHVSTTRYTSADATAYCDGLDLGGKSDWRLPGVGELATLVNLGTSAIPMMDREAFPDEEDAIAVQFWAASLWALNFWGAEIHHYSAADTLRVRCVR